MSQPARAFVNPAAEWPERLCPVCRSAHASTVFAEADFVASQLDAFAFASRKRPDYMHYRLLSCAECDLLYANPAPAAEAFVSAYDDAAFDTQTEAAYASRTYGRFLKDFAATLPGREGALDIGTGDGAFLGQLAAAGFTGIVGVEPSRAPIAAARSEIRPLIRHGMFRADDFASEQFSLVTCFQTLEHVYDPDEMCRGIHRLLRKGGGAFFVCHDRHAWSARLLGLKSPIFDIEHLQLFSARSATRLLEQCGFTGVHTAVVLNSYPLDYWVRLAPIPAVVKRAAQAVLKATGLGAVPIPLPAGNIAVFGYKEAIKEA